MRASERKGATTRVKALAKAKSIAKALEHSVCHPIVAVDVDVGHQSQAATRELREATTTAASAAATPAARRTQTP